MQQIGMMAKGAGPNCARERTDVFVAIHELVRTGYATWFEVGGDTFHLEFCTGEVFVLDGDNVRRIR